MVNVNIINENYEEIETAIVNLMLDEVFKMVKTVPFINCGEDRLQREVKEITSVDFLHGEITVMVIENDNE